MAHDPGGYAGNLARLDSAREGLQSITGNNIFAHAYFDAEHRIGVFCHSARSNVNLRVVNVEKLRHRKPCQTCIGNMHKSKLARAPSGHNKAAVRSEIVGTSIARRHHRGRALVRNQFIGRNTNCRAVGIGVAVQVNQTRRDQLAACIHDTKRAFSGNAGLDGCNEAITNPDVALS